LSFSCFTQEKKGGKKTQKIQNSKIKTKCQLGITSILLKHALLDFTLSNNIATGIACSPNK